MSSPGSGGANATASLRIILEGVKEINEQLDAMKAKLQEVASLSAGINMSGGGNPYQGTGAGGPLSSDVISGSKRRRSSGMTSADSSVQMNAPSAQADMDLFGLSAASQSAGTANVFSPNFGMGQLPFHSMMALPPPWFSGMGESGGMAVPPGGFGPIYVQGPNPYMSALSSPGLMSLPGMGGSSYAAMNPQSANIYGSSSAARFFQPNMGLGQLPMNPMMSLPWGNPNWADPSGYGSSLAVSGLNHGPIPGTIPVGEGGPMWAQNMIPVRLNNPYQYSLPSPGLMSLPGPGGSSFGSMNPQSAQVNFGSNFGAPSLPPSGGSSWSGPNNFGYQSAVTGADPMQFAGQFVGPMMPMGNSSQFAGQFVGPPQANFMQQWNSNLTTGGQGQMSMMSLIGLHYALRQFEAAAAQGQQVYSDNLAGGKPYYEEAFAPGSTQMTTTIAGMVIGGRMPGVGPAVGAAAGAYLGQNLSTTLQPYVDRDIAGMALSSNYGALGMRAPEGLGMVQLDFAQRQMSRGTPLNAEWAQDFQSHASAPSALTRGVELGLDVTIGVTSGLIALGATRSIPAAIGIGLGAAALADAGQQREWMDSHEVQGVFRQNASDSSKEHFMQLANDPYIMHKIGYINDAKNKELYASQMARAGWQTNPREVLDSLSGLENNTFGLGHIAPISDQYKNLQELQYQTSVTTPYADIGLTIASMGGSSGISSYYSSGIGAKMIGLAQKAMSLYPSDSPQYAQAQAALMQLQFQAQYAPERERTQEITSMGSLAAQNASQSLQGYLVTGGNPFGASVAGIQKAMTGMAAGIRGQMGRGGYSPAEQAQMESQASSLEFQAQVTVPRSLEGSQISYAQASLGASQAGYLGAAQLQSMAGPANQSGAFSSANAQAMREQANLAQEILDKTQYRTAEERKILEAQVAQASAQAQIYDYQAKISNIQGVFAMATTGNLETRTAATNLLVSGVGGAAASGALAKNYSSAMADVAAAQAKLAAIPNPNSAAGLQARQELAGFQSAAMQAREAQALVPYGGHAQAQLYTLESQRSALESGVAPGTPGAIRTNISQEMGILRQHIQQIDAAQDSLRRRQGGRLDEAQESEFARQRGSDVSQLAGLTKEANYGFFDRLMSAAYNLPQNAWYARAMFSNREASMAGILHPSIGGTQSQIQQMSAVGYDLRQVPSAAGMGSPGGFNQATSGAASGGVRLPTVTIPISLVDARSGNVLSKNDVMFENGKQVSAFNTRTPIAARPSA